MALRDLDAQTMIAVSEPWLDPQADRPLLESHAPVAGVLGAVESAHEGLLGTQRRRGDTAEELARLSDEMDRLDRDHDRTARGLYYVLDGAANLADDPARADELRQVRDELFPDGLSGNTASYLSQAGNVRMVAERIDGKVRDTLDALEVDQRPLGAAVDAWIAAGTELGQSYTRRARLAERHDASAITDGDVHQARLAWIKAVNAFLAVLDLCDLDPADERHVLTPLHDAMRAAERPAPQPPAPEPDAEPDAEPMAP